MAYLWTTIKYLTAALLLSYTFWAYTEGEDALPYWYYTWYLSKQQEISRNPICSSIGEDPVAYDQLSIWVWSGPWKYDGIRMAEEGRYLRFERLRWYQFGVSGV